MQYRFFTVPVGDGGEVEAEVNRFLRSVRVLRVDHQFVAGGNGAYWALCVEFLESPKARARQAEGRVDYKEVLSEGDFAVFARLRELRKALAAEEAVPVYTVCTNEELAEMARCRPATLAALQKIEGIGEAKARKFGERFVRALQTAEPEAASAAGL